MAFHLVLYKKCESGVVVHAFSPSRSQKQAYLYQL